MNSLTQAELRRLRVLALVKVSLTQAELAERFDKGTLSPEEWEAWEQVDWVNSLLE